MRVPAAASTAVLLALAGPCRNECDFVERCDGNVRQVCGGVDQLVGRHVREVPCSAPNASCVATGLHTQCVRSPATPCDSSFAGRCEDGLLVRCLAGYVVVEACAAVVRPDGTNAGLACGLDQAGVAACLPR